MLRQGGSLLVAIHQIVRSRRRSIALIITDDAKLVVRAPWRVPDEYIIQLVSKKRSWIERKLVEMADRPKPLSFTPQEKKRFKKEALVKIRERCALYAAITGYKPASVKITSAEKRWGSCGPKGTVNFSWRLILKPLPIIDYVVVHELVHLAERNHSRRFWDKVGAILPDYKLRRRWLKENGGLSFCPRQ